MKKFISFTAVIICVMGILLTVSCAALKSKTDVDPMTETGAARNISFSEVTGREWKLLEVYVDNRDIRFRRENQPAAFTDIYTLIFDDLILSGSGAPNRYSAPYTIGENQTIRIQPMRSTLMASFLEPVNLSEHEYMFYLQNTYSWTIVNRNLELSSRTENGRAVRMVFGL